MLGVISEDSNHNKIFKPMAGATLGQGVPLGAWCSFEKDVAPSSNWLMAGTTFDATKYPALNLYLGTNKVPSRYDHNRPSDYESITLSTDSNNPTVMEYDGEINSIIPYQHSDSLTVNGVVIADTSMHAGQTFTVSFKKGDEIYARAESSAVYKVRYYTHPLFIKATSIASDTDQQAILAQIQAFNTYSTEETLTGETWLDGKPIYRKCYAGNLADNQLLVDNVSEQIGCGGIFYDSADNTNPFPYYSTTYSISCGVKANTTKIVGYTSGSSRNVKIWIKYTKTTD